MIPLVATRREFDILKAIVDRVAGEVAKAAGVDAALSRRHDDRAAARRAAAPARSPRRAEFFSFGTNDLTQTDLRPVSRDDAGALPRRLSSSRASSQHDPFVSLDIDGRRRAGAHRRRARPRDPARPQARHLRRAWRRPGLDPLLRRGRPRLRLLLALPRADRPPGRGAGGARPAQPQGALPARIEHTLAQAPFARSSSVFHPPERRKAASRAFVGNLPCILAIFEP